MSHSLTEWCASSGHLQVVTNAITSQQKHICMGDWYCNKIKTMNYQNFRVGTFIPGPGGIVPSILPV